MAESAEKATPSTEATDEQSAVKPFGAFLHEHRQAGLHNELGEALAEVVAGVLEFQKTGSLGMKISIAPAEGDTGSVVITDQWASKVPKPTPPASRFYSDPKGKLSRRHPDQPTLPFEDVNAE